MDQECEWTYRKLFDEALANYQSLQGMQVDWLSLELGPVHTNATHRR